MMKVLLAAAWVVFLVAPAAAGWSGDPYGDRTTYHTPGRTNESAGVRPQGRDVAISPGGKCWFVSTPNLPANAPPGDWKQYIPFKSDAEFDSYRAGNGQAGHRPVQCAFNMPVSLCGSSVGQTGHRPLGTVVGPFTFDTGTETVTLTLRADRQGTSSDYGWSVASQAGSCDAGTTANCNDPAYAAAHPASCGLPDPRSCDNADYSSDHPLQCGVQDPYCPSGYSTHVFIGLSPTYFDESGPGFTNPNTSVGCARTSPAPAVITPIGCRSWAQQAWIAKFTTDRKYGFPNVGFCAYYGSLDRFEYDEQWGHFPTFCANALGSGLTCGSAR